MCKVRRSTYIEWSESAQLNEFFSCMIASHECPKPRKTYISVGQHICLHIFTCDTAATKIFI